MVDSAMDLLLEQAEQEEEQAQLSLVAAQQALENYLKQIDQIEQYRLEYFRTLSEQGLHGLSANKYSHLNRFITQLDETLVKQRGAVSEFEKNVEQCREHWQGCRARTRALAWLIEKRAREALKKAEKAEQKQQDEFAVLAYLRQKKR